MGFSSKQFSKCFASLSLVIGIAFGAAAVPGSASAATITFTHEGSTTGGTLDGVGFGGAAFKITAVGDTDDRADAGGVFYIDHVSAQIEIDGLGVLDIVTGTRTFINDGSDLVGFSREGGSGLDLFNGPSDAALDGWDMLSSIGPIGGSGVVLQWDSIPLIDTSGGILILNTSSSPEAVFTAVVDATPTIPLPAAGWLLIAAIGGLGALRARKVR